MGISGLTSYINNLQQTMFKERIKLNSSCLVIDGFALFYALMKTARQREFGGDYDLLREHFNIFFSKLSKMDIQVYVVLDGGNNIDLKKATIEKRKVQMIEKVTEFNRLGVGYRQIGDLPIPLLSMSLFREVMEIHENVKYIVCDQEADLLVASLANQLDGYVVTNDSDFFLLDLKKGLITITSLCDSIKQSQPYCTIYKQQNLSQYLGISADLLPIIALVLGNDYSVDCYRLQLLSLMGIQPRDKIDVKIEHIMKYLKGAVSVDRLLQTLCCGNEEMQSQLSKELEEYNVHQFDGLSQEYIGYFETQQKETAARNFFDSKNKLKNFIDQLVRAGLVDACVLDLLNYKTHFVNVQCELIAKRCTSVCSSVLRRYLYGMLLKQDEIVVEYTRSGQEYRPKMVRPSNDLPSLNELWSRSEEERQSFFLDLLDIPLEGRGAIISPAHQSSLFLITLQYFTQVHSTSEDQTNAFLEMHLILRNGNRCFDVPHLDQALLHVYSSFHTVFYYINLINTLLGEPFVTPKASQLMSGSVFQSLCQRGNKDFKADYAKEDLTDLETYQNFILPNMMDKVQPRSSSKKNRQHHHHHHRHHQGLKNSQLSNDALPWKPASQSSSKKLTFPSTNKKPSAQASNKNPSNRFQLLSISDDE